MIYFERKRRRSLKINIISFFREEADKIKNNNKHHFYFKNPISYDYLLKEKILQGPPQSITELNHKKYQIIKLEGRIDERFTFN